MFCTGTFTLWRNEGEKLLKAVEGRKLPFDVGTLCGCTSRKFIQLGLLLVTKETEIDPLLLSSERELADVVSTDCVKHLASLIDLAEQGHKFSSLPEASSGIVPRSSLSDCIYNKTFSLLNYVVHAKDIPSTPASIIITTQPP